jgi:hypothetical protein
MKFAVLIAAVALPAVAQAQPAPPYSTPYAQPSPYAPQVYRPSALPSWVPPTLPPGSPGITIPMPAYQPPPPMQPFRWQP